MLRPLMHHLERRLHARDFDLRVTHPFDWGLEFLDERVTAPPSDQNGVRKRPGLSAKGASREAQVACAPSTDLYGHRNGLAEQLHERTPPFEFIRQYNDWHLARSEEFFTPPTAATADFDFTPDGSGCSRLSFPSGMTTPYEKNNLVRARFFPAGANGFSDRAVIVSPQWNAKADSHVALCRALNRFGISALRLSLPYHDERMPDGFTRADFMVSANIGRTIQAVRQAVLDTRRAADWLFASGHSRVGLIGTSIGSCVSWLAFIHDHRFEAGVFNMVSSWFGDVVWRALTTTHIRRALETELTAEETREVWKTISPVAYADRLAELRRPALCISARHDMTFLPDLAQIFFDECDRHGAPIEKKFLSCGHYTIGRTPFKYIDAFHIVNYFRRLWRSKKDVPAQVSSADATSQYRDL